MKANDLAICVAVAFASVSTTDLAATPQITSLGEARKRSEQIERLAYLKRLPALKRLNANGEAKAWILAQTARYEFALGAYDSAMQNYRAAYRIASSKKDRNLSSYVHAYLCVRELALKQPAAAKKDLALAQGRGLELWSCAEVDYAAGCWFDHSNQPKISLERHRKARREFKELHNPGGEAKVDAGLALIREEQGLKNEPLAEYRNVRRLYHSVGDLAGEASTLYKMGYLSADLSQIANASSYMLQASALFTRLGFRAAEATTLVEAGNLQLSLGQPKRAVETFQSSVATFKVLPDPVSEAKALNDLGAAYRDLNQKDKSLDAYTKAHDIFQSENHPEDAATALANIGDLLLEEGDDKGALANFQTARDTFRKANNPLREAEALHNIGRVYLQREQPKQALQTWLAVLPVYQQEGDPQEAPQLLADIAEALVQLKNPNLAIVELKRAVNLYQHIRSGANGLRKESQQSLRDLNAETYRELANLLVEQGRIGEAEQVMALLKDSEYDRFIRATRAESIDLKESEGKWDQEWLSKGVSLAAIDRQFEKLKSIDSPTPAQIALIDKLQAQLDVAEQDFQDFLDSSEKQAERTGTENPLRGVKEQVGTLARALQNLPDTAAVLTILTKDGVKAILTLPNSSEPVARASAAISYADLSKKIFAFRAALTDPSVDPLPLASDLYELIVRPSKSEIDASGAKTVIWSLDGVLRWLPLAALYDKPAHKYFIEEFANSLFTTGQIGSLASPAARPTAGVGYGVSKAATVNGLQFRALVGVPEELAALTADTGAKTFEDELFTEESLRLSMMHRPSVLHLATHFRLGVSDADSFLLLGNGKPLSLQKFARWRQNALGGVDLLVLSACDTGTPVGANKDGDETESFARRAQEAGAGTVVASLWEVEDYTTSALMAKFYALRKADAKLSKVEAVRQAQLWLMAADPKAVKLVLGTRRSLPLPPVGASEPATFAPDPKHPFRHPYFWAPFVLTGNIN